ncbi:hypothetical protein JAAARDRAFT_662029 [Jaapia argillacea MUCL 33604]|uniref:Uncharacterized protein n=1 Tax=Jaapia argillacea MUCL 33604 TaxID=933084 RepID=A0A067P2Z4_9AGAM|nr:hypothetical protein JAAARDRAFT_662029 [Jaapia argillacea MUCL 33604]
MGVSTCWVSLGMEVEDGKGTREPLNLGSLVWAGRVRRVLDGDGKLDSGMGSSTRSDYPSVLSHQAYCIRENGSH